MIFEKIPVKRLHPLAILPNRAHFQDAGADLHALIDGIDSGGSIAYELQPGQRGLFRTGLAMAIPIGFYGRIAERSGLAAKHGIAVLGGVIDSGYRGEIHVLLLNTSCKAVEIKQGDRIAQLIVERCDPATFVEVLSLEETDRGANGFGSTGIAAARPT